MKSIRFLFKGLDINLVEIVDSCYLGKKIISACEVRICLKSFIIVYYTFNN